VHFTDLGIADELENKEFRDQFFRTERELDIPAQIKALRKFRGMTQKQLAEKVGTKQSAICRLERAQETNWELETLVKHAEALDARLAVIIEPYETVAARCRAEAKSKEPLAATAYTATSQSEALSPLTNGASQIKEQTGPSVPVIAAKAGGA
jgi:transcriptional regulator with XRE-family HTH domain